MTARRGSRVTEDVLRDLIMLTEAGDPVAFAAMYDELVDEVDTLVRRQLREPAQAPHVTSAVFLEVWRRADGYRSGRGSVRTWVLTIAHRRAAERDHLVSPETAALRDQHTERALAALLALADTVQVTIRS